jgi:hypothetical protein
MPKALLATAASDPEGTFYVCPACNDLKKYQSVLSRPRAA